MKFRQRYGQGHPFTLRGIHKKAKGLDQYLRWLHGFNGFLQPKDPDLGFRVTEHPAFGGVDPFVHSGSAADCPPGQPMSGCSNHYSRPNQTADINVGPPGSSDKELKWLARWERLIWRHTPVREAYFKDPEGFHASQPNVGHTTHGHACWDRIERWRTE